ncbi:MAG: polyphosphate kinase 2 family protein [Planctomycetes bacterium]|nr:polyphosphate kinase 2 family protein [Planctomycetota bacterium]
MSDPHLLKPGQVVRLSDLSTRGKDFHDDRDKAEAEFFTLRDELVMWQRRLYAEGGRKLLVVLQATDTGGKDGAIRHVFRGVNPQGVEVTSFKAPTRNELDHDFLWRVHANVPAAGMIGVFNRSHYEDVLVVRVDRLAPDEVWRARYEHINRFEKLLDDTGTTIVKFFLHISRKEQKKRLQKRIDNPDKNWKFSHEDLQKRKQWDEYQEAYEEMLSRCGAERALWRVIPADQKWYRNLAVCRTLVETLREMNPQFPKPIEELSEVKIE